MHGPPTELMLFLALAVVVALTAGLWPAVVSAVLGSLLASYWFTSPHRTWTIADSDDVIALAVFVLVAVAVASVVDLASRRAAQAARSSYESQMLTVLASSVLRGDDTSSAVLSRLRETFRVAAVGLWERPAGTARGTAAEWRCLATSGEHEWIRPDEADLTVRLDDTHLLGIRGRVPERDQRVLRVFAAQSLVVLERERLRDRAAEAHRLEQGIAIRTALLTAVSHDLRTPLAAIKAAVSTLRQDGVVWDPADEAELLATVEESADRLQRLIDNLLDLSRLQTGVVQPLLQPLGLDEVVPQALEGVPAGAVDVDVPESLPPVLADAGLVERLVANVVENAVRYAGTPAGGVRIEARDIGPAVELRVVDHGPGVPQAARAALFRPFQRGGDRPGGTGLGLGLAVARGFAEAMDGTLMAEETDGGGLTMVLRLPVAAR